MPGRRQQPPERVARPGEVVPQRGGPQPGVDPHQQQPRPIAQDVLEHVPTCRPPGTTTPSPWSQAPRSRPRPCMIQAIPVTPRGLVGDRPSPLPSPRWRGARANNCGVLGVQSGGDRPGRRSRGASAYNCGVLGVQSGGDRPGRRSRGASAYNCGVLGVQSGGDRPGRRSRGASAYNCGVLGVQSGGDRPGRRSRGASAYNCGVLGVQSGGDCPGRRWRGAGANNCGVLGVQSFFDSPFDSLSQMKETTSRSFRTRMLGFLLFCPSHPTRGGGWCPRGLRP